MLPDPCVHWESPQCALPLFLTAPGFSISLVGVESLREVAVPLLCILREKTAERLYSPVLLHRSAQGQRVFATPGLRVPACAHEDIAAQPAHANGPRLQCWAAEPSVGERRKTEPGRWLRESISAA